MNLKPIKDQVLIKEIKKEEKTKSGIILPDTAEKQDPAQGEIIAMGEGKTENGQNIPLSVKVGDKVLFKNDYGVDKIKLEGEEYLIMREDSIIAIIN